MPDEPVVPPVVVGGGSSSPDADESSQSPSEFDQAQLETIRKSESLARSAGKDVYQAKLVEEGLDAGTPEALLTAAREWRRLSRLALSATQQKEAETGKGEDAELLLQREVEYFRGKARLKITKNPAWSENEIESFKARYFINRNLFISRAHTEQSVEALLTNAAEDALPGVTPARVTTAAAVLSRYVNTEDPQTTSQTDATSLRKQRDRAFDDVMRLRHEIQFAADTAFPWHDPQHLGLRREFLLPAGRAFTG